MTQRDQAGPERRPTKKILFLCTGNYYRSRFSEELFNHLAAEAGLDWQATSRGIALERGLHNVGPISAHALRGLRARNLEPRDGERYPTWLQEAELAEADLVVALKETEHRPLLQARFPAWAERVEYWHIDDEYDQQPEEAVAEMERLVRALVERLEAD